MYCLSFLLLFQLLLITNVLDSSNAKEKPISIRLCCNPSEYFNTTSYSCEHLPTDFSVTTWEIRNFWSTGVAEKVNILEDLSYSVGMYCQKPILYKFFEYKNDPEHCYSPYYHKQKQKYIMATLDCDFTVQVYTFIYDTYILGIGISTTFLLITLVIYMKAKELNHTMYWKIFLCYVISWMGSHMLVIICICLMCTEIVPVLWFFFTSSRLWLNVLGFEVWLYFTYTFKGYDLEPDWSRFLLYSLDVWGVAIISALTSWCFNVLNSKETLSLSISTALMLLIALITFAYIVYKLFVLRLKVLNKLKGKHFTRKSILILLGIFYLMISSWIIFLLWLLYPRNAIIVGLFYAHIVAEGPILFGLFVPKRSLRFFCVKRSYCQYSDEKNNAWAEEMQTFS